MTPEEVRNEKLKKELIEDRRKKIDSKEQNTKKNPIDFRILLLIVAIALTYQLYLSYGYSEEYKFLDAFTATAAIVKSILKRLFIKTDHL